MEAITIKDAELARLVALVLQRPDAGAALDYVLSTEVGGPWCSCGAMHWSCNFGEGCEECGGPLRAGEGDGNTCGPCSADIACGS